MKFTTASAVESVVWQMKLADYPRGLRRAKIDELANGFPPYTEQEAREENLEVNTNDLTLSKILHDARRQFGIAHLTPDPLFTISLDFGPAWQRQKWQGIITKNLNRKIKKSLSYLESRRSVFANVVRQGPGPVAWEDRDMWCPEATPIEDILVPSNTLLTLKNIPFFCRYRQYTAHELYRLTSGPKVDPAWNLPLVKKACAWVDEQSRTLMGASWPEVWAPEKMSERIKSDGGVYASDAAPTVECLDFYFWDEDGKQCGWKRRMILDAWGQPGVGGLDQSPAPPTPTRKFNIGKGDFLYDSKDRIYADKISEIVHFQFADASAVAPFRYHSVRSLGFLLYAVCHLQNRLHCRFNEATFESLMQYFRVANPADMDRPGMIKLINKGVLREGVNFVPRSDRWQVDANLVNDALQLNRQIMADNSASFTQDFDFGDDKSSARETATRTNAKSNASAALVGSMLAQSYEYQLFQYREICRRFCKANSRDPDVRGFRKDCLTEGVPSEAINVERWDIQANRVLGGGNKSLQIGIADRLWQMRAVLEPQAQKQVDRIRIVAYTDDYNLAEELVQEDHHVTNTVHDTENTFGSLMAGAYVEPAPGLNPIEVVETMLNQMEIRIGEINQSGAIGEPSDVAGLSKAEKYTAEFIRRLSQVPEEKQRVAEYGKRLGKLMNFVKAFAQRQQEAAQKKNGQMDPQMMQKLQADMAEMKLKIMGKAVQMKQGLLHKEAKFQQKMRHDEAQHRAGMATDGLKTANDIGLSRLKALQE